MRQLLVSAVASLTLGLAIGLAQTSSTLPATTSAPASSSRPATTLDSGPGTQSAATSQPATYFSAPTTAASQPATIPGPPPPTAAEFPQYETGVTDEQIVAAIKKAADFLLSKRTGDNFEVFNQPWTRGPTEKGGETALIVYALVAASESLDDGEFRRKTNFQSAELAPLVTYLKNLQPDGTYAAALMACALTSLPRTPDIIAALERFNGPKAYLFKASAASGGYEYSIPGAVVDAHLNELERQIAEIRAKQNAPGKKDPDAMKALAEDLKAKIAELTKAHADAEKQRTAARKNWNPDGSNTQYGVLGAWAMAEWGIHMPSGYWMQQDGYWRRIQYPDGSFPYSKGAKIQEARETMSPAGLASLYLTQEFLDVDARLEPRVDKNMDLAVKHISENFNPKQNDQYYGYGIERVGVASGLKFFGTHEWYRELASDLVKSQSPDGSWTPAFYAGQGNSVTIPTCYALLILSRGRNPVLINKLDYGTGTPETAHWNNRSRDVARLTEKMAKALERPLNWQIVTHNSKPEDWMDAPILYISGSQDPNFSAEDVEKLKAYVEMGGIIFSNADGEQTAFTEAVKKYASQIVPGREMRELPPTHPLFNGELWTKIDNPPKILSLSNGVRELWIHSTVDMGATWQKRTTDPKSHWDFPGNVYFYATGKVNLKNRLQSLVVNIPPAASAVGNPGDPPGTAPPPAPLSTRPRLTLARLLVGDNPDPEPGAWPRMARLMRNACEIDMEVRTLTINELAKEKPPVVHLTGTTAFTLPDKEVQQLRDYLNAGGTLLADSSGMSEHFTESFKKLCAQLYPKSPLTPLPLNFPVYYTDYNKPTTQPAPAEGGPPPVPQDPVLKTKGTPILAVRYRPSYMLSKGLITIPHLQAVRLTPTTRAVILFSEEDLTSGLLGTNTWGIMGYTPESSRALARNMLLYALHRAPAASTRPAPPAPPTPAATTTPATQPSATQPATQPH